LSKVVGCGAGSGVDVRIELEVEGEVVLERMDGVSWERAVVLGDTDPSAYVDAEAI